VMSKVYVAVGHGIRPDGVYDPGATGGGWTEQSAGDIIVAEVARLLQSWGVVVTDEAYRADPNFPGTIKAANAWGADYIVEVHHDWSQAPIGAFGHWYTDAGKALADDIQQAVGAAGFALRPSWHKRRTDLTLLKATNMPAVIYECGRIGQESLNTKSELIAMGVAIAKGIAAHVGAGPKPPVPPPPEHASLCGLFIGDEQGRFNWDDDLTREQADALFARLIAKYHASPEPPPPPPTPPGVTLQTPVAGVVDLTVSSLVARLPSDAVYNRALVAGAYIIWCRAFNLRLDVVWCQMILETDGLRYTGDVDPVTHPNNFCGLKNAEGSGWAKFATLEAGVIAHCAHLAAYVFPAHVRVECNKAYDPRHPDDHAVWQQAHGKVTTVSDFGQHGEQARWAEDPEYAAKLVRVWERGG